MRSLPSVIFFLGFIASLSAQNPHGADMKINCAACHTSAGWKIDAKNWEHELQKPKVSQITGWVLAADTIRFHHNQTRFELKGAHATTDCRACHSSLVFSGASTECVSCHTDMHQQTVGNDCARCHTSKNWIVDNISELHFQNGFPLTGVHQSVGCEECHTSASALQFNRIGNDCASCHLKDFRASAHPNHVQAGFSQECTDCHNVFTPGWGTDKVDHDFFPLVKGHDLSDCASCHTSGSYANTPNTCVACHQPDYTAAASPNHVQANFSNDCASCHTIDPDWMPAKYLQHDAAYFPIYSGKHQGVWSDCAECHTNPSNYTEYSCVVCHINPETDNGHAGVNGYIYENSACLACHPTGDAGTAFDHNTTNFPLTGAHLSAACTDCHASGFVGTPTQCVACHSTDFNQTVNPNHVALNIPTDCAMCHTTAPGWEPATFPIHNNYYALNGAHAGIANDCATCHNGNYNNTPNTCNGCHAPDYAATTNPNHAAAQFPTDCATCHSETAWTPTSFNHNSFYLLNGAHGAIANDCNACHNGNYTNTPNTCNGCHAPDYAATTDPNHAAAQFPTDCATCHNESSWTPSTFDHNAIYPFTGAHIAIANDCNACHQGNYTNTPNTCAGCHTPDYSASANPNHTALNIPTDCAMCHTTAPGWEPATFPIHNNYYALNGAHAGIANDCATCHNGNYTNTPNTCNGCHAPDYAATTSPNHAAAQFPTDCATCHSETAWTPSTFNHNSFYPLNGAHAAIANDCNVCHNGNYTNTPNTCNGCHAPDYAATTTPNHAAAQFPTDCATCHNESAWTPSTFDHNAFYPFTGAHIAIANDCNACHQGNYTNTPNTCAGCHTPDYAASANPNHAALNIPTDCAMCHTTNPGWEPATFPIHNNYYALNGAHAAIANDCTTCHNGNYNNTPNTCNGCHAPDYAATNDPSHTVLQFSTDCATCHTESAWTPATFDHDEQYFPIYSGAHDGEWSSCTDCHTNPGNYAEFTCTTCHGAQQTNNDHNGVGGYTYNSPACLACHPTGSADNIFNHNSTNFPLTGAHLSAACMDCHAAGYAGTPTQCAACHTPDYNQTANPNHVAMNISTDCAMCHTTDEGWAPATFPTHVSLSGAHAAISDNCTACHNGNYNNTPNACNACHAPDYAAATEPNHAALQFPTDCSTCHSENNWSPSTFDHNTVYPFTGAHVAIANDCDACHHGNYTNTPNTCAGCHTSDFNQTANPNHVALNIPTDCAMCHTTASGWEPATFPIHNNYYALNGAHAAIAGDCATCHNGNYNNTPNTCNGCHAADFAATNDPDHVASQFPTDCAICHSETAWAPSTFDHNAIYPFTGAHIAISHDCDACHNGNYSNTPNTCAGCHAGDYNGSTNPNHSALGLSTNCTMCHTTDPGWEPATFPVHNNYYPLQGAHAAIASDCATCHHGNYNNTPNTCNGCHAADYAAVTDPNHAAAQFPTDCATCHSQTAWSPSSFNHNTFYPLNGAHVAIANDCAACHHGDYTNTPNTCNGCHAADYAATTDPNHALAHFPTSCASCHSETAWTPSTFDHNAIYPFTGAHIAIANDCEACHNGNYTNTPNTCVGCHQGDFNGSTNPNHSALGLSTNCATCHTTDPGWEPATFPVHNNYFVLQGAHATIASDCAACHHGNYNNTPNTCNGCHAADYAATTDPNHAASHFPTNCATCHSQSAWSPSTFNHNTVYPFTGAHIPIANDCDACHNGNYTNTPNTCSGCHIADYNGSTNPNHSALGLSTNCATCHTTDPGWDPATFPVHNNYFVLQGAHATIASDCAACHHGNYNNTPNTCNGCHAADYAATTDPNHAASHFPTNCATCHSQSAWTPSTFNHNAVYPFTGAHIPIANDCDACHNGNYTNTPNTCAGCHTADYNASTNPNHVALGLSTNCATCHTTNPGWEPATFPVHNNYYVLQGAHATIASDCAACHHGNYNNTPNTCNGCHAVDYAATTNPNHAAAQFPTTCTNCHSQTAWSPTSFNHNTIYPFTGAHIPIASDCNACHHGNYTSTPNTCAGCHTADYNASTNPNHVALGLSTNCVTCHTTDPDWDPATFPVHNNYYVLQGAHATIASNCAICHNGNYNNTPNTCNGCHAADYAATTNPNHAAAQFPTDCTTCHSQTAWSPSTFNHNTIWPITGAHTAIANNCNACHNGNYTNTPNTCYGCHAADYTASGNSPNHVSAGFPTDCAACHSQNAWSPSTFNHDSQYFPIYSGTHHEAWDQCTDCHTTPGNYATFSCIQCHEHNNAAEVANDHDEVNGFQYTSTACYSCHPNGNN